MMYSKPSRNAFANPFLARVYPDPTLAQFHPRLLPLVYFQSCVLPHVHLLLDFGIELFQTIQGCVNSQCGLYYTMRKNTAVRHPTSQLNRGNVGQPTFFPTRPNVSLSSISLCGRASDTATLVLQPSARSPKRSIS